MGTLVKVAGSKVVLSPSAEDEGSGLGEEEQQHACRRRPEVGSGGGGGVVFFFPSVPWPGWLVVVLQRRSLAQPSLMAKN